MTWADWLFVAVAFGTACAIFWQRKATSKLTLEGVGATTLFFSDRPERIAGNVDTAAFVPFWSKGKQGQLPVRSAECRPVDPRREQAPAGRRRPGGSGTERQ
ncbi:hypothetical protein [Aminobacter sp. AP02]|uniref:hypothetical protein n=1 Tax=Aminobacter sp. AP02 TaxID=2135737 RepID=UPI0011B1E8C0|nr:hypothetical protein [Aminobacter sp. AP02]